MYLTNYFISFWLSAHRLTACLTPFVTAAMAGVWLVSRSEELIGEMAVPADALPVPHSSPRYIPNIAVRETREVAVGRISGTKMASLGTKVNARFQPRVFSATTTGRA